MLFLFLASKHHHIVWGKTVRKVTQLLPKLCFISPLVSEWQINKVIFVLSGDQEIINKLKTNDNNFKQPVLIIGQAISI